MMTIDYGKSVTRAIQQFVQRTTNNEIVIRTSFYARHFIPFQSILLYYTSKSRSHPRHFVVSIHARQFFRETNVLLQTFSALFLIHVKISHSHKIDSKWSARLIRDTRQLTQTTKQYASVASVFLYRMRLGKQKP